MTRKTYGAVLVAAMGLSVVMGQAEAQTTSTLTRGDQPVVLTGAQVGALQGSDPADLVGFRYDDQWVQIPIQVDERHVTNIRNAYPNPMSTPCGDPCYSPGNRKVDWLIYSDDKTLIGGDPDPTLDANDEIVFMTKDTGGVADSEAGSPAGVIGDGVELALADPIDSGTGYVYLFERDATADEPLEQSAGISYVEYVWQVVHIGDAEETAAQYKDEYRFNSHNGSSYVGNPEDSWVETAHYRREMTGRWHDNVLINKRGDDPADILQRHDASITLDQGGLRNQVTFDRGEMAYITSKGGPIRAIREFLGTNSGPLTQRRQIFYESHEELRIDLRVHAIPGASEVWNYNDNAIGMRASSFVTSDRIDGQQGPHLGDLVVPPSSWRWETLDQDTPSDPSRGGLTHVVYYNSNNPDPIAHHIYRDGGSGGSPSAPYRGGSIAQGPAVLLDTDATASGPNAIFLLIERYTHYEETGAADGPGRLAQRTAPVSITATNR